MAKKTKKQSTHMATYEIDIAQEFKDVKNEIVGLKHEISSWQKTVEKQLTKLNDNMDRVLSIIAEHEGRLTKLEHASIETSVRREELSNKAKLGWMALKVGLGVGALFASVAGCGVILKLLAIF